MTRLIALACVALLSTPALAQTAATSSVKQQIIPQVAKTGIMATAQSPNGRVRIEVSTDNDGHMSYTVFRNGKPLIGTSRLGFNLTDGYALFRKMVFDGAETASANSRWEQPWGERRFVVDHHNELLVKFHQDEPTHRLAESSAFACSMTGSASATNFPNSPTSRPSTSPTS